MDNSRISFEKEKLRERLSRKINEGYRKEENIKTIFHGTKPSTEKGMLKRINDLTKNGQLNTRTFTGLSDAFDFYKKILGAVGSLHCLGNFGANVMVQLDASNNMSYFGIMRAKDVGEDKYKASITFSPHSDETKQPEPEVSEPTIEDENNYEICCENAVYKMTGSEFYDLVKESVFSVIGEDSSFDEHVAMNILDDLQMTGEVNRSIHYPGFIEWIKGKYACSDGAARIVANKIGIK